MEDNFDKILADKVRDLSEHTEFPYNAVHWDELLATKKKREKRVFMYWRVAAILLVGLFVGGLGTMENGQRQAEEGVAQVQQADNALAGISDAVGHITDMANQIAAATEEQSAVAEEVNRKVITIAQLTEQTAEQAERTSELSNNLLNTARGQFSLVERFNR